MTTIPASIATSDVAASPSPRGANAADPSAFAAELQSATDSAATTTGVVTTPTSQAPVAGATAGSAPAGADATAQVAAGAPAAPLDPGASPPALASDAPPVAQPSVPTVAVAQPATPTAAAEAAQAARAEDAATAAAQDAAPTAQPSAPVTPTSGHKAPRHALDSDTLPAPVAASSLPSAAATVASSPLVAPPAATAPDDQASTIAAATVELGAAGHVVGPVRTGALAARGDDTVDPAEVSNGVPADAAPTAPLPAPAIAVLPSLATAAPVAATAAVGNVQRSSARIVATPATASGSQAFATALAQPSVTHAASTEAAAAPAAPPVPQPLNEQLAPPLLALRTAGSGTHVLILTVSPDTVGPVTVRAHVTGDTMRVELSAPTAQGTDALKSMLPDLKRDLAQGGMNSALTISSSNADGAAAGQNPFGGAAGSFARDDRPAYFRTAGTATVPAIAGTPRPVNVGATSALDVLA